MTYLWPPVSPQSWPDAQQVLAGEEVLPRWLTRDNSQAIGSQQLRLSFFTALKTETVTQVRCATGSTAAGATPTLVRMGVYSVAGADSQGDLTLLTATASDTSLLAAANTAYTAPLTTPLSKVAGQRYAVGLLVVTAAATPTLVSIQTQTAADPFAVKRQQFQGNGRVMVVRVKQ